jgi:hypothetical protein
MSKGIVDIVFLLDATGSMQPCINAVKDNIFTFAKTLCDKDANGGAIVKDWRARVVGYRDYLCDAEKLVDNPFVTTSEELRAQLDTLVASGGGDEPESLLDALLDVVNVGQTEKNTQELDSRKWRYRSNAARCVIVFTDATFHPTTANGAGKVEDVINSLHSNRIILSIYAPDLACHHDLAAADKSEYLPIPVTSSAQQALADYTADKANFQKVMVALAKSVSKSADVPSL